MLRKLLQYLIGTFIIGSLAIGRFYDPRLNIEGFNLALFVQTVMLFLLIVVWKRNNYKLSSKSYLCLIVCIFYIAYQLILFSIFDLYWIQYYSLNKMLNLLFLTFFPALIFSDKFSLNIFIYGLLGFTTIFFIIGMIKLLQGNVGDRMSVLGGGPIVFARWISVFIILILCIKIKFIFKLIILIAAFSLIYFSASKGPVLALFISISYILFAKNTRIPLYLTLILIFSLYFLNIDALESSRIFGGISNPQELTSVQSRIEKLKVAYVLFKEYPLGLGLGNYPRFGKELNNEFILTVDYPHNIFAEIAVESGIIWLILFIVSIIFAWGKRNNFGNVLLPSLFLLFLINTQFSGDLSNSKFLIILLIIMLTTHDTKKYLV